MTKHDDEYEMFIKIQKYFKNGKFDSDYSAYLDAASLHAALFRINHRLDKLSEEFESLSKKNHTGDDSLFIIISDREKENKNG